MVISVLIVVAIVSIWAWIGVGLYADARKQRDRLKARQIEGYECFFDRKGR